MKYIKLPEPFMLSPEAKPLPATQVLSDVLDYTGERGITVIEHRNRARVLDAIEACDGKILALEDAHYAKLMALIKEQNFVFALSYIDEIYSALEAATDQMPAPEAEAEEKAV